MMANSTSTTIHSPLTTLEMIWLIGSGCRYILLIRFITMEIVILTKRMIYHLQENLKHCLQARTMLLHSIFMKCSVEAVQEVTLDRFPKEGSHFSSRKPGPIHFWQYLNQTEPGLDPRTLIQLSEFK